MKTNIFLLLALFVQSANAQKLYVSEFITLLKCANDKPCFENIISKSGYKFIGEFDAMEPKYIEARTDKDSVFMSLCKQKAATYIYESSFMYKASLGGKIQTTDKYYYQHCNDYNQVTYWTSVDLYPEVLIEKTIAYGFIEDSLLNNYPSKYADKYFFYKDSAYIYRLFIKSYNLGENGLYGGAYFPRFQIRMRREKHL